MVDVHEKNGLVVVATFGEEGMNILATPPPPQRFLPGHLYAEGWVDPDFEDFERPEEGEGDWAEEAAQARYYNSEEFENRLAEAEREMCAGDEIPQGWEDYEEIPDIPDPPEGDEYPSKA